MIIGSVFIGLFLLFFLLGRYSGPAHLASIAGVAVNAEFGGYLVNWVTKLTGESARDLVTMIVYLVFVLGFPMILYLKSHRFKHGPVEAFQTAVFALLVVTIIADPLARLVNYDTLSATITSFLDAALPYILVVATATGYFDILMYRKRRERR
jgi:energy-converting hydrogenase Eha subunit A